MNAGFNAFDVIDSLDQESSDYGQIIFDVDGNVEETVLQRFPNNDFIGRLLVLESMKIDDKFRGRSLGLLAARRVIEFLGHSAFVIMKPFPLQFGGFEDAAWVPPDGVVDKHKECEIGRKKLYRYWKRLGCKEIGKTGYLAIGNTEGLRSIKAVLKTPTSKKRKA
jgi:hypothetical protein